MLTKMEESYVKDLASTIIETLLKIWKVEKTDISEIISSEEKTDFVSREIDVDVNKFLRVLNIYRILSDLMGPESQESWVNEPHKDLGDTPLNKMKASLKDLQEVETYLQTMQAGMNGGTMS